MTEEQNKQQQNQGEQEDFVAPEELEANTEQTEVSLEDELKHAQDQLLRTLAELDNFKKRTLKERSELIKYQGERIFQDLLDVIDNFDLAVAHKNCDLDQLRQGLEMIHKSFHSFLEKWEVKGVSGIGASFDPNSQNAISTAPAAEGTQPGQVVAELKKAYFYKDKLLRPGDVIVAVEPK